ncbi:MAG: hypothetical protein AAFN41_07185, partial [Planctomycetota bacterium]
HKDRDYLDSRLGAILEIYEKFVGEDPRDNPMRIFPAVHYSMGGMWSTYTKGSYDPDQPWGNHKPGDKPPVGTELGLGMHLGAPNNMMTNVEGLYTFGEVNFAYHGATRLGANALLSCIFDGLYNGLSVANYVKDVAGGEAEQSLFDSAVKAEEDHNKSLVDSGSGDASPETNPYTIANELGVEMTESSTVVKTGERLTQSEAKLAELRERFGRVRLGDAAQWTNQSLSFARATGDMLILAEAIVKGGNVRKESRGSHYRLDYPDRDDANFLKATVAKYEGGQTSIELYNVDTRLVTPRARTYGKTDAKAPEKKAETANAS